MKIGVIAPASSPVATPDYVHALGAAVEERGFHSLWAPEHVVLFDEYASKYPYSEDGRLGGGPDMGPLEPFVSLAFLASATKRIRLGTGVLLVPQRNPVYTAKSVASLDWLSGGRVDLGVGVGWLREEFASLGVPWERRGERTRSYLGVMRSLWCDDVSAYKDEFYELAACRQFPKPVQKPHPPVLFGGESDAALARVAELGDGWYGFSLTPASARERIAQLSARLARAGRKRRDIRIYATPAWREPLGADTLARFAEAGVDQLIVSVAARSLEDLLRKLDRAAPFVGAAERL
ncbi:MAG TPA: LLM class F420-dependent oxidoreductase [Myxococcota bacterium]|jgi:probable F420-dependent oxidoreductase